jgi:hypothetical protein
MSPASTLNPAGKLEWPSSGLDTGAASAYCLGLMIVPPVSAETVESTAVHEPNPLVRKSIFTVVAIALTLLVAALLTLLSRPQSAPIPVAIPVDTNVMVLSIVVTRGTNHTFLYPDYVGAVLRELRPRLGLARTENTTRQVKRTPRFSEVFWVTCSHSQRVIDPRKLQLTVVDPQGRTRRQPTTGGISDPSRRVWVNGWPLPGGPETHRGVTMHIETVPDRQRLVTIQLPY